MDSVSSVPSMLSSSSTTALPLVRPLQGHKQTKDGEKQEEGFTITSSGSDSAVINKINVVTAVTELMVALRADVVLGMGTGRRIRGASEVRI